jgi:ATP synthase protein I
VRQNIATQISSPTQVERTKALKVVGFQAIAALIVALVWLFFKGLDASGHALTGGLACVIPNLLFTWVLFKTARPSAPKQMAIILFVGELLKLVLSALAIGVIVYFHPNQLFPALSGFVGAYFGTWLTPLFISLNVKKREAE